MSAFAIRAGRRIGIYGGTFNPIHLGHLRAAEEIAERLALERIVFVPSAKPPHKGTLRAHAGPPAEAGPLAPAADRLAWVRAAIADNPRFEVDELELARAGASYTVDTLALIGRQTAPELPTFIIGHDAFAELGTWKDPQRLLELAHFAVMSRPPTVSGHLADWLPEVLRGDVELAPDGQNGRHRRAGTELRLVEIAALDISASDIRARLRQRRSVRYLLPEAVRVAVEKSGVFA
jgi:nicotinate-nucleotide adenylyltransferase